MLSFSMRQKVLRLLSSVWFITLFAFVFRAAYALYMSHLIPAVVLSTVPFQNEVGNVASALAQGHGFCCLFREPTGPTAWLAPVYPLLIAGIFKLFGTFTLRSFYAAVFLNCLFSSLASIPVFYCGKRVASQQTAVLASWLWAIFPSGIILPFEFIWDTSLSAFFAAALLWRTLKLGDSCRRGDAALYGLLWGFSLLTNPTLGVLLPFLLAWVLYRHRTQPHRQVRVAAISLSLILAVCAPWTVRNYVQFHRFIPMRCNFPYEFWSGNNELFDEHSRELNRITRYEQTHLYSRLGENAFLTDKWHKATHFVRTHPHLYIQLCAGRVVATWLGTPSPFRDFLRADSSLARFLLLWNALALVGIVVGLVRLYLRRRIYFLPLASYPLFFPLTFYIAHTSLRHRHPCDPVVALLIAIAVLGTSNLPIPPKVR
jgi:4-amino-4-deoxy-L-arabinose transferase-like glycosyltransferase